MTYTQTIAYTDFVSRHCGLVVDELFVFERLTGGRTDERRYTFRYTIGKFTLFHLIPSAINEWNNLEASLREFETFNSFMLD